MEQLICIHCKQPFNQSPRHKTQTYCQHPVCKRARKARWQRDKMKSDPDYRLNQKDAMRNWRKNNLGYYKQYRKNNPDKAHVNRVSQALRRAGVRMSMVNKLAKEASNEVAKMDASNAYKIGLYGMFLLFAVAKMDASIPDKRRLFSSLQLMNPSLRVAKKDWFYG